MVPTIEKLLTRRCSLSSTLPAFTFSFFSSIGVPPLTDKEKTVLCSLLQGLSNKQFAERMHIRETAVKFYLQTLFRKTGVHARSQLVRVALEKYREELGN